MKREKRLANITVWYRNFEMRTENITSGTLLFIINSNSLNLSLVRSYQMENELSEKGD